MSNPKALLFASSLLPQFIDEKRSTYGQLGILVMTTVCVDSLVLAGYALLAYRGTKSLRTARFKAWCERVFGLLLIVFGGKLLFARK